MKVLLINPLQRVSLYSFTEISDITGTPGYMPNLALPTLAALTPPDVTMTLVDEAISPIPFDGPWDLVGITGYVTQKQRMFEIADEFRRRGKLVAIGGPYASLSTETVRPHADIIFIGEAEHTWPAFLADFKGGTWLKEYGSRQAVDFASSPLPKLEGVTSKEYAVGVVQTSRGCPFECEFCDVIIYLGRKQRHKAPARVVEELEQLHRENFRAVFLSDDNFTANRRRAAEIMTAVRDWNRSKAEPMSFVTQLSIDVARDQDMPLLELCAEAGLKTAFVGVETPDMSALKEVNKKQNLRGDLVSDVRRLHRHGIMVQAGMISGFDSDTRASFRRQYDFVQEAGVPMVSVSTLNAPEGTPLEQRMIREGRLKQLPKDDFYLQTNIVPKGMSSDDLYTGTVWLLNKLYSPDAFLERVAVLASDMPVFRGQAQSGRQGGELLDRLFSSFKRLPAEYRKVPLDAITMFRRKDLYPLITALMYFRNVINVLTRWNAWNPELCNLDEPNFSAGVSREPTQSRRLPVLVH